jgi:1A family penicillin-binding protein
MAQKNYHHQTYNQKAKLKRFIKSLGLLFLFFILITGFIGLGFFIYYAKDLPRPEMFNEREQVMPTRIYDRTGETLLRTIFEEEKRETVTLSEIPEHLINAVLATEDANFYNHKGVDFRAVGRAILIDIKLRKPVQGASTISQQLIRSTFLSLEKTVQRKVREAILTLELERRYSKEQILEWYLNQVSFGPNIYGVGEANSTYFNKPLQEISIAEAAILASLIRAPSYYYPYGPNLENLLNRKNYVLNRMTEERYISEEQALSAKEQKIEFTEPGFAFGKAAHFILYIENYLYQKYGSSFLKEHGLKVYTTLNLDLQQSAEKAVKEGVERNKMYRSYNASLVAIDPKNGEILAMVGSKDYFADPYPEDCTPGFNCKFEPKVNVATYGQGQQPGSAFKPFAYATAFKKGYTPDSIFVDEKTNFGKWGDKDYIPTNYDGLYRGPVTIRQALAQSLNIPSIKVLLAAGIGDTIDTAHDLGITTLNEKPSFYGPSLVLGAGEVKLIDMVSAYGVFANNGLKIPYTGILKIEDRYGNIIEENKKTPRRVLNEEIAETINDILSDNVARTPMFGAKSRLYFPNNWVAAKTGTTDGYRDAWTIGYTHSIAVGVWTGNNDNSSTARKPGVTIAGPIWNQFIQVALNNL